MTCQVVDIKTLKMLSLKVLPIWPGDKQVKIVSGHVILAYFCDLHSQLLPSWFTRRFPQLQSTGGLNLPCQAWENANFGLEDFEQMQFRVSFQKLELNSGVLVQVQVQV